MAIAQVFWSWPVKSTVVIDRITIIQNVDCYLKNDFNVVANLSLVSPLPLRKKAVLPKTK